VNHEVQSLMAGVKRRWLAQALLQAVGRAAAAASIPLIVVLVAARILSLGDGALTVLVSVAGALAVALAGALIWRIDRQPDDRRIARFIEERVAALPDVTPLDDSLVSAVDARKDSTPGFQTLLMADVARRLDAVPPGRIVPPAAIRRAATEAIVGTGVLALTFALGWPLLGRAVETAWAALFPQSIQMSVTPGDTRVAAGRPLTIRASVRAGRTILSRFSPELTVTAGGDQRTVPMTAKGDEFEFSFESVDRTFRYRVSAGSARSQDYTVTAIFAPRVDRIDLRYEYPSFSGLSAREEKDGGDIYAPAGTRVRVRVHADKAIASGSITLGNGRLELRAAGDKLLEADLTLDKDDSYRVELADADGLRSSGETEYFIRLMDDRPPDVHILRPAGDQQITPLEEVAIEARADDDYGISRFELVYSIAGRPPKTVLFTKTSGTEVMRLGAYLLAAEDLKVQPGDVITCYARALDIGRGKRPTETRSDMFFLEVRPFSEEFVLAQSQAMSGMAEEQIESLIAAQKEIINATWNIERRAGAGRSADDIRAVAAAQAELKARAEEMIARSGRGRPPFQEPPQQIAPQRPLRTARTGADPVSGAIASMGRALDQLEGQRTGEALPHEMAALQALLQAQAEIRRREVMQQSGSSGGGLGRQGQDLSALFDKELQRQQRTNYETRSQIESRPDKRDYTSALDRIRDLARRQEELSRRQRELANSGASAEEMRRQLERLTREQAELRNEAEELARQMGQSSAQQQGQGSTGGSGQMREASDEMRNAASDLRRQDPKSAADRAERAANQLRRLEQQMRGDTPEARQRAAGEMRLEAQQIADEQRRIAAEAGRLEKGEGTTNQDAWRRLAGEKDKLADRVDDLQRAAGQLGRESAQDKGASAAARELEQEQVSRRMRDTAKQMRDPAGSDAGQRASKTPSSRGGSAEAEQQIARILDRVVDQLGGGAAETQDLSSHLDQTRSIRDRLDRLERQIKEAESKESSKGRGQASAQGSQGREGREGAGGSGKGGDLDRLREEYARELQKARETLSKLERSTPKEALGGSTPEQHEWSGAAPGTEAFKQDYSRWEALRKQIDQSIERYEAAVSSQIAKKQLQDRLSAGGSESVPDAYRKLIARYYESLARKKR
jgi:archaellum component FlaC